MKSIRSSASIRLAVGVFLGVPTLMSASGQELQVSGDLPAGGRTVTLDIAAYANLCGEWTYRTTEDGRKDLWKTRILGTRTKAGKPVYLMQEYDEGGYPNDQEFLSANLSRGLYQTGGLNDYRQKSEETWFWKPATPKLMKVFVPGAVYDSRLTRSDMPGTGIDLKMVAVEDTISVPYGKNIKCYRVTQTYSFEQEKYVFKTWYAEHLGLVKRIQEDGTLWELTDYQPAPWLVAEQPAGSSLFDGVGNKNFGTRSVGQSGTTKTFTIRNAGTLPLSGLVLFTKGDHRDDFRVSAPLVTELAPGKSTTFKVTFSPTATGTRKASVHVAHKASNGNPFNIPLSGVGAK